MSLAEQRATELVAKLASLHYELAHWKKITDAADGGLRRHYTQVRRLAASLDGLTQHIRDQVSADPDEATVLARVVDWEQQILAAHSIWEVFRAKLVLRHDALFRDVLAACDDLAWACYRPALERFEPDRKGPPLVYLSATWSPFAVARDSNFLNEVRAGPGARSMLTDEAFQTVLDRLPIPLIGLPWYQAYHLPGALIIGHEAGHVVERDFKLNDDLSAALRSVALVNPPAWHSWRSEVFADLYGCLCLGPAFVGAMMSLLATSVDSVQKEARLGGAYPTRALRVELMLEALHQLGFDADTVRLRSSWEAVYGAMQTMQELVPDIAEVVCAVYRGPYRGVALTELTCFPTDAPLQAIGETAAAGYDLKDYDDPRQLLAAAQWLHENPQPGEVADAFEHLIRRAIGKGHSEYRMRGEPVADRASFEAEIATQEAEDRRQGSALAIELFSPAACPPP